MFLEKRNMLFVLNAVANSTTTRVSTITNNGSTITYTEDKPYVNLIYTCQKSQAPMSFGHIYKITIRKLN